MRKQIHSLFLLLFCIGLVLSSSAQSNPLPQPFIAQADAGLLYDTEFKIGKKSISGIVVLKSLEENYHVVLLSKFGYTLMDFVITDKNVRWNKKIPGKEKSAIHNAIEADFRLILLTALKKPRKVKSKKNNIYKIKSSSKMKLKLSEDGKKVLSARYTSFLNPLKIFVNYTYAENKTIPKNICLSHNLIRMAIIMNRLDN